MRRQLLSGVFICVWIVSFGQLSEVRRITETLCSPEFHGRGYVNKGDSIAAAFIASEFQKIGIKPIKKSYFQPFALSVQTFPGKMEVFTSELRLKPGIDFMVDPSSAGFKSVLRPKYISLETILDEDEFTATFRSVISDGKYNAVVLDLSAAKGDTLKKMRGLSTELARYTAIIEVTAEKFTWAISDHVLKYPLIYVKPGLLNEGDELQLNIEAKFIKNYTSRNVVAYLPAKKKSKKTIVYTAHYDHLGRMGSDTYFPGANDNASGTAMLISMAKYFKENPQDYNVLFIAFAGEEAGLHGSKYFVEHPLFKLKKMSFLLNLDIMGSGEEGITVVNATLFEQQFNLLKEINTEKNLLTQVKSRGPAANSDHYWFTQKNVPAFFIYTMGPNKHYHDVFDTYEELSFQEYEDITTLLVEFGKRVR
jgi:aminopeptidase YwaD